MHSMTGCGTGKAQQDGWEVTADLKSVNHRFLDLSMRLPRNIAFLEPVVRKETGKVLKRGHVDVFLTVRNTESSGIIISVDQELARQYCETGRALSEEINADYDISISKLLSMEGVITLTEKEMDQDCVSQLCTEAMRIALEQMSAMRLREGTHLKEDLLNHLEKTAELRQKILMRAPQVVTEYREKLEERLKAMMLDGIDPQRLAQETAIMADRCAVDEELSRLESHIRQMKIYLEAKGEIGKKMDFLIQEMNRETNTIGSKAQDGEIAQWVVEMKSEIEKLREQIQNVE